jgi:hypothetical protein
MPKIKIKIKKEKENQVLTKISESTWQESTGDSPA